VLFLQNLVSIVFKADAALAFTIKLFTAVIVAISLHARVLATVIHFHSSLIFASKAGAYKSRTPNGTAL